MNWNLILDWSGTLVDDLTPVWKTTNLVLQRFGRPGKTLDEFRREFQLPVSRCYSHWVPGVSAAELEMIFVEEYGPHRQEIKPLPGTTAFLEFCRAQGWQLFIASTVDDKTYHSQMRRFGLDQFITKPYVGIVDKTVAIHQILAENGLAPAQTVFVGDMEHDIEAGKAGGVRTCAVLTGYNHEERLRAMEPDWVCAGLGELQEVLTGAMVTRG
jgi:phosphoglycolate phosphatase